MEFEKNLKDLEKLVDKMSSGEMSLDEAIKSFEKGMELVKKCRKELNHSEQKVQKLIKVHESGRLETETLNKIDFEN